MMPRNTENQMHSHIQNLASKHRVQISFNSMYWLFLCARKYTWHYEGKIKVEKIEECKAGILNPGSSH